MTKRLTTADLPEDVARFAEAQIAAGHYANVDEVVRACFEALERKQRREARIVAAGEGA